MHWYYYEEGDTLDSDENTYALVRCTPANANKMRERGHKVERISIGDAIVLQDILNRIRKGWRNNDG